MVGIDLVSPDPDILVMDMHDMSFEDAVFDAVYASHSLEHAYDVGSGCRRRSRGSAGPARSSVSRCRWAKARATPTGSRSIACVICELHWQPVAADELFAEEQPARTATNDQGTPVARIVFRLGRGLVKVASLETLFCDAGWRPWIFLKATADDGLVGWAEVTDSHGSPRGLAGIVEDLAPLVVGRDPRAGEAVYWDLYRATRQSPGGVVAKAIAAIENALLDLKGKALGVPVYELFGGPLRTEVPAYWSHCGTTRARAWEVTGTPKLASYDDVTALGREVVDRGFPAFKTNVVIPGDEPSVLHPGFHGAGLERNSSRAVEAALVKLLEAFAAGTGGKAEPIVDLNFNLTTEGARRTAMALAEQGLAWLEIDCFDPAALAFVRRLDRHPHLLRREPLRRARVPPVSRGGRARRRLR